MSILISKYIFHHNTTFDHNQEIFTLKNVFEFLFKYVCSFQTGPESFEVGPPHNFL